MTYYKPQVPLQKGSDYIYPLTTIDQVVVGETQRLNTMVTNPNLLDNPWFTVNQRGITSKTVNYENNGYVVDRWMLLSDTSNGSASFSSNGATFNGTSTSYDLGLVQIVDDLDRVKGKTVTFSIWANIPSGKKCVIFYEIYANGTYDYSNKQVIIGTGGYEIYSLTAIIPSSTTHLALRFGSSYYDLNGSIYTWYPQGSDWSYNVKACKLELGSVSTLGNDHTPDYATELLKCKRYLQVYDGYFVLKAKLFESNTHACITFPSDIKMRAKPTLTRDTSRGSMYMSTDSGGYTAAISFNSYTVATHQGSFWVDATFSGGCGTAWASSNVYFENMALYFSADL